MVLQNVKIRSFVVCILLYIFIANCYGIPTHRNRSNRMKMTQKSHPMLASVFSTANNVKMIDFSNKQMGPKQPSKGVKQGDIPVPSPSRKVHRKGPNFFFAVESRGIKELKDINKVPESTRTILADTANAICQYCKSIQNITCIQIYCFNDGLAAANIVVAPSSQSQTHTNNLQITTSNDVPQVVIGRPVDFGRPIFTQNVGTHGIQNPTQGIEKPQLHNVHINGAIHHQDANVPLSFDLNHIDFVPLSELPNKPITSESTGHPIPKAVPVFHVNGVQPNRQHPHATPGHSVSADKHASIAGKHPQDAARVATKGTSNQGNAPVPIAHPIDPFLEVFALDNNAPNNGAFKPVFDPQSTDNVRDGHTLQHPSIHDGGPVFNNNNGRHPHMLPVDARQQPSQPGLSRNGFQPSSEFIPIVVQPNVHTEPGQNIANVPPFGAVPHDSMLPSDLRGGSGGMNTQAQFPVDNRPLSIDAPRSEFTSANEVPSAQGFEALKPHLRTPSIANDNMDNGINMPTEFQVLEQLPPVTSIQNGNIENNINILDKPGPEQVFDPSLIVNPGNGLPLVNEVPSAQGFDRLKPHLATPNGANKAATANNVDTQQDVNFPTEFQLLETLPPVTNLQSGDIQNDFNVIGNPRKIDGSAINTGRELPIVNVVPSAQSFDALKPHLGASSRINNNAAAADNGLPQQDPNMPNEFQVLEQLPPVTSAQKADIENNINILTKPRNIDGSITNEQLTLTQNLPGTVEIPSAQSFPVMKPHLEHSGNMASHSGSLHNAAFHQQPNTVQLIERSTDFAQMPSAQGFPQPKPRTQPGQSASIQGRLPPTLQTTISDQADVRKTVPIRIAPAQGFQVLQSPTRHLTGNVDTLDHLTEGRHASMDTVNTGTSQFNGGNGGLMTSLSELYKRLPGQVKRNSKSYQDIVNRKKAKIVDSTRMDSIKNTKGQFMHANGQQIKTFSELYGARPRKVDNAPIVGRNNNNDNVMKKEKGQFYNGRGQHVKTFSELYNISRNKKPTNQQKSSPIAQMPTWRFQGDQSNPMGLQRNSVPSTTLAPSPVTIATMNPVRRNELHGISKDLLTGILPTV